MHLSKQSARRLMAAATAASCLFSLSPAVAASAAPAGRATSVGSPQPAATTTLAANTTARVINRPRGIVPRSDLGSKAPSATSPSITHAGFSNPNCPTCAPPLVFHPNTPVMGNQIGQPGHVTITPIYWNPGGFNYTTNYKTIINGYLQNVAAASGLSSNNFSVGTQYYQQLGTNPNQHIQYVVATGTALDDTRPFPAQGVVGIDCTPVAPSTVCITDLQLQNELVAFLTAGSKTMNDANLYMVFFPNQVDTCFYEDGRAGQACSSTTYCGYHGGLGSTPSNTIIYANEPFPPLSSCASAGAQAPNSDAVADAEISIASHEANESITDSYGAWMDTAGFENGDECAYTYGRSLGGAPGTLYNQVINGAHYYTQDEFSNEDYALNLSDPLSDANATAVRGCVQRDELPTASFTFPTLVSGTAATFNGTGSADPDNTAPLSYAWNWGDLTANSTGASPSHTYSASGTFPVVLTVTDGDGWVGSVTHIVNVSGAPGPPTAVNATAGNAQVGLTWTAPANPGTSAITGYSVTPYIGSTAQAAIPTGSATTSFTVTGLTNGTTYTFTVAAINSAGTGIASAASNPVTPHTVPGAPTGVNATAGDSQASLSWTAPASDGGAPITGYSVIPFIGATAQSARPTGSGGTSFTVTGLSNGTTYTFTVAASNSAGTGAPSAASNPVTPAAAITVPGAPTGVIATAGVGSATLTWTPPASNGGSAITRYTVTASTGPVVQITLPPVTPQAVMPGLMTAAVTFTVTATNTQGTGPASAASNSVTPLAGGTYHPLVPARILDTRTGVGAPARAAGPLGAGQSLDLQVNGGMVPTTGVSSVILNVTVTGTTAAGFLSVWPQGNPRPLVSNLNWVPGKTIANLVEVAVGPTGMVSFYNSGGNTDLIVDMQGYVGDNTDSYSHAGLFNPLTPQRVLDTRTTVGGHNARLTAGETLNLIVTGPTGAPAAEVSAVVLNVTAVYPTAAGFLTVWPAGATRPTASNLNFLPGQVVPNRVIVGVGPGGQVSIYNPAGMVDVVADINGWFTSAHSAAGGSAFIGTLPMRLFDTRVTPPSFGTGSILTLGPAATPAPPTAVVLNVTAVAPTSAGFLTLYPDNPADPSRTPPTASDLNFVAGDVVPNLAVVKLGSNSKFDTYNPAGSVDVVYDEDGYYGAVTVPPAWVP